MFEKNLFSFRFMFHHQKRASKQVTAFAIAFLLIPLFTRQKEKKIFEREEKQLIIFYAINKILLEQAQTAAAQFSSLSSKSEHLEIFFAKEFLPIEKCTSSKNVMNSIKCLLKVQKKILRTNQNCLHYAATYQKEKFMQRIFSISISRNEKFQK